LKDGFVVNTILKEADLFCPNSVRINFTIYLISIGGLLKMTLTMCHRSNLLIKFVIPEKSVLIY
ncbi:hypothetical protein EFR55_03170, partial [Latilactobacillus curvatus]|nr:hypothetical protein [Latilactobacillus curvatus]